MPAFPKVRVGEPVGHEALMVFPLFSDAHDGVAYLLSDEALPSGAVTVEEVNEAGSVPNLLVDNRSDSLVLFLEGEELRGAKQNRVLNTSVLAGAQGKTTIPVSCVEQGRWRYRSKHFGSEGSHASPKLRHVLKKTVTHSALGGHGHGSDQGAVWQEVGRQMSSLGACSPTGAMADTYQAYDARLREFRDQLKYVEGASGLAVAVGGKVVSVDLFDKPATCRRVWDRLLSGVILDALEAASQPDRAQAADVQQVLQTLGDAAWQQVPAVGAGEEFRADLGSDRHGSALTHGGTVVHGSLVLAG